GTCGVPDGSPLLLEAFEFRLIGDRAHACCSGLDVSSGSMWTAPCRRPLRGMVPDGQPHQSIAGGWAGGEQATCGVRPRICGQRKRPRAWTVKNSSDVATRSAKNILARRRLFETCMAVVRPTPAMSVSGNPANIVTISATESGSIQPP